MKIKISEYIADFLVNHKVDTVFTVTGGGAMHLNDAFGHHEKLHCVYNHHEQGSAIAAEGYTRLTGKVAAVCVTSGPGGTNAITGVFDCFVDSVPMFVVSGQVKRETTIRYTGTPLRQLGDQECDIVSVVEPITKFAVMITNPNEIRYQLEKAWYLATHGRRGPVWIDVPLDIQGAVVDTDQLTGFEKKNTEIKEQPVFDKSDADKILEKLEDSRRPVILAGEGIRLGEAYKEFIETTSALRVPVLTCWNAQDLLWDNNPYYVGIPGTVGQRAANFIVQAADLLIVLGCRMNIRNISYNKHQFAENAYKIQVDIDENELCKPTVKIDMPIHADVKDVCAELAHAAVDEIGDHTEWLKWCKNLMKRYPTVIPEYYEKVKPMNPYAFLDRVSENLEASDAVICGNGAACVQVFQTLKLKKGMRVFTNSGSAEMGFALPAALGAAASGSGKRIICIDGDGSFMMNMQELQTIVHNGFDIKIIILNNNGYHSIRQTQKNLFSGREHVGIDKNSGVSFPDLKKIASAFGLSYVKIDSLKTADSRLKNAFDTEGPVIIEALLDWQQDFEPKTSSKVMKDGTIVSAPLDDMFPFLPKKEYEAVRKEAQKI
ncbi:MAG: thiamine pyrophosphate-binding protein [Lachnospiraceae bacterium]|nr:thiamine pyrophosphate-binding protein [Lachnospiraceae bacterium]